MDYVLNNFYHVFENIIILCFHLINDFISKATGKSYHKTCNVFRSPLGGSNISISASPRTNFHQNSKLNELN